MEKQILSKVVTNLRTLSLKRHADLLKGNRGRQKANLYKCDKCKDTGWILIKKDDGREVAISCECREREKMKNQWKRSGINIENCIMTFANFNEWNDYAARAKSIAITYLNYFSSDSHKRENSILFCGQVGSGKTHLAIAISLNLMKKNYKVVYMPYRDSITKLKQIICTSDEYLKLINKFKNAEVLLIDDLYKGRINETDVNIMFEIINYRYVNYLPIIVSTEFDIKGILKFDESIGSRIYEMCKNYVVEIKKNIENNYRLRG